MSSLQRNELDQLERLGLMATPTPELSEADGSDTELRRHSLQLPEDSTRSGALGDLESEFGKSRDRTEFGSRVDQEMDEMDPNLEAVESPDLKSVEYAASSLMDQLLCPICHSVFTEPYSTSCGHTFCKECILGAIAATDKTYEFRCPVDRRKLDSSCDVVPAAYLVTSLVNDLSVCCPFKDRGCTFEGKRWDLSSHVDIECGFVNVKCGGVAIETSSICERPIERKSVREALKTALEGVDGVKVYECLHEVIECERQCGFSGPRHQMDGHLEQDCRNIVEECPACGAKIPKPDLESHRATCPETVVPCSADQYGCVWTGKRKEFIAKHSQSCPLIALTPMLARQDRKMKQLETENRTLRYHVERLISADNATVDNLSDRRREGLGSSAPSSFSDSDLLHMFMECERLRADVDRLVTNLGEVEVKQGMMIMRENYRTAEEIAALRAGFNSLRHQMHFLLSERRSSWIHGRYDDRPLGGRSGGAAAGAGAALRPDWGDANLDIFRQDVKL